VTWPVELTAHARARAAERFPGLDADAVVSPDVHDALRADRVSPTPPPFVRGNGHGDQVLFLWTCDRGRVYVLGAGESAFHVRTILRGRRA